MPFTATPITVKREAVEVQARSKGGLLGKIFVRAPLFKLSLEYRKFYLVTLAYRVTARKFPFKTHMVSGQLPFIVDALMAKSAVVDTALHTEEADGPIFQSGRYDIDAREAEACAEDYANRIIMRMCRNLAQFTAPAVISILYRPFWIAYYGNPEQDSKPRYLSFEADGLSFNR